MTGSFKLLSELDESGSHYHVSTTFQFNCYWITVIVRRDNEIVERYSLYAGHSKEARNKWMDNRHTKITKALRDLESALLASLEPEPVRLVYVLTQEGRVIETYSSLEEAKRTVDVLWQEKWDIDTLRSDGDWTIHRRALK